MLGWCGIQYAGCGGGGVKFLKKGKDKTALECSLGGLIFGIFNQNLHYHPYWLFAITNWYLQIPQIFGIFLLS